MSTHHARTLHTPCIHHACACSRQVLCRMDYKETDAKEFTGEPRRSPAAAPPQPRRSPAAALPQPRCISAAAPLHLRRS